MPIIICPKCGAKNRVDERGQELRPVCGRCHSPLPLAGNASGVEPFEATDANFQTEVLGVRGQPVLVDCWAQWCGPCRLIAPTIEEIAAKAAGRWRVAKLNVDFNPGIAGQFRIESIPTLLIFKDGKVAERIVGVQSKSVIESRLAVHAGQ